MPRTPKAPKLTPMQQLNAEIMAEIPHLIQATRSPVPLFITGALAAWAGYHTGQNTNLTLAYTLFAYLLALMAYIDLRHGILPHILTGTLLTVGTLLAPTLGLTWGQSSLGMLVAMLGIGLCGAVAGFASGRAAMGGGDLWLTTALGAWLGLAGLPMLLVATAFAGLLSLWFKKHFTMESSGGPGAFPFGPALCAAGWLALLYSPWYWKIMDMLTASAT